MSSKPTIEQAKVSSVLDEGEGVVRKILVFNRVASTKEMYADIYGGHPVPEQNKK